jgi:hypothetical protein
VRFKYKRGHSLCSKNITICYVGAIREKVYGKWVPYIDTGSVSAHDGRRWVGGSV